MKDKTDNVEFGGKSKMANEEFDREKIIQHGEGSVDNDEHSNGLIKIGQEDEGSKDDWEMVDKAETEPMKNEEGDEHRESGI